MSRRVRSVLITGCSSGIGRATALRLARRGWRVWAGTRGPDGHRELEDAGCEPLELDVCDADAARRAVGRSGPLDALINNAGYGLHGAVEEVPLDAVRAQLETNLLGAVRLCQLVLPGMRARGEGRIVNMSSMGGRITFPGGAFYHASKHALEAFSDALRWEVRGLGVHVVLIEPGPVRSTFGGTGIGTLGALSPRSPYAGLHESIRAGLRSTFDGPGSERASTPEQVAEVCERALNDAPPAPRYVVGEMAGELIARRASSSDDEWDRFLELLYDRPGE